MVPILLRVAAVIAPAYPALVLILIYGNWLVAYLSLGRAPRPTLDDPKHIDPVNAVVHWLSVLGVALGFWLFWAAVLIMLLGLVPEQSRRRQLGLRLGGSLLAMVAVYGWVRIDPGAVVEWYFD